MRYRVDDLWPLLEPPSPLYSIEVAVLPPSPSDWSSPETSECGRSHLLFLSVFHSFYFSWCLKTASRRTVGCYGILNVTYSPFYAIHFRLNVKFNIGKYFILIDNSGIAINGLRHLRENIGWLMLKYLVCISVF